MRELVNRAGAIEALQTLALSLGASACGLLDATDLVVEERFALMCGAPTPCPSYGLAPGCPPHAPSVQAFRKELAGYRQLLVFKIDTPMADLLGENRLEIARTIHRLAATLEGSAQRHGLRARGMAAGSCKELFCGDEQACVVLSQAMGCRHPDLARPSISAVGVDFAALAGKLGWPFGPLPSAPPDTPVMGLMAGLVLLG